MKKITFFLFLNTVSILLHANIHIVTSNGDDKDNPTTGMLRYFIENCSSGDTIQFAVDSVRLDTTIRISYKKLTINGGEGVIIDGNNNGTVFNISASASSNIVLNGLIIQNGNGEDYGGGMYLFMTSDAVLVENCIFRNNIVTSNSDAQGGGVRTNGGTFKNCIFLKNQATGTTSSCSGGGVFAVGGTFINCLFVDNHTNYGGGIYASGTTITNCTFTQNSVEYEDEGGGISSENSSTVTNCIFYNNKANDVENNIQNYGGTFSYCALEVSNSMVGTDGNKGLSETPFLHSGTDSLSLNEESICVNGGNSSVANLPETDIIGNNRIIGSAVDIGAYEISFSATISGKITYENSSPIINYTAHPEIITDAEGNYEITTKNSEIEIGDTLELTAPDGFNFHPGKIIIGEPDTINIVAYKGLVVDEFSSFSISENWDTDTVNIFCDIILDSTKLTISPNTKIKFYGHYGIQVTGTGSIVAEGTATLPILFTSADTSGLTTSQLNTDGAWDQIVFENMNPGADTSIFKFCKIEFSKVISDYGEKGGAFSITSFNKILFTHCQFYDNMGLPKPGVSGSLNGGGALRINSSDINIINCGFINNYNRDGFGGAIYIRNGNSTLVNCTFIDNKNEEGSGGAIYSNSSNVKLYNSILRDNYDDSGKQSVSGSSYYLYNCNIEGGNNFSAATFLNCIDIEPLFVDGGNRDFSLQTNSPCINSGTLDDITELIPDIDINGNSRVYQELIDMGINEYQQNSTLTISGNLRKENGDILSNFNIFSDIHTDESGNFTFSINNEKLNIGDTIGFNNPAGYEIYPTKIVLKWDEPRDINLVAYKGIVIDKYVDLPYIMNWEDTVNVFTNINLDDTKLLIKEGTLIRFHTYSGINVSKAGAILAQGTKSDSITFTYAYPDLSNPSSSQLTNCWKGISFNAVNSYAEKSIFQYCKIAYAKKSGEGGGVYIYYTNKIEFHNCEISYNVGLKGGGIYMVGSNIDIINSTISNNIATASYGWGPVLGGGGTYLYSSNSRIIGCIFEKNSPSYNSGGGMLLRNSSPSIINCSFYNTIWENGLGESIYLYESTPQIYNSILYGDNDNQIESYETDTISKHTVIYNSCIKGGNSISAETYKNCIELDPLFTDIANPDFSLQNNSPCINMGIDSLPISISSIDILHNLRIMGDSIDIGAIEFPKTTLTADATDAVVNTPTGFSAEIVYGTGNSWSWDFNGDNIEDSDIQNPTYTFADTGIYTVRTIAYINELGKNDTLFFYVEVYNPLEADFSVNYIGGSVPLYTTFTDKSINNPTSWYWDFGDGNTSNLQNPHHTYSTQGNFTVTLICSNDAGSDTITKSEIINISDGYLMKTGSYTTDNGYFYDDGGFYGAYSENAKDTLTFFPKTEKYALSFNFQSFRTYYKDTLYVYDGTSTSAPLIGAFYNTSYNDTIAATNTSGALTFVFSSQSLINFNVGWTAKISCVPMFDVVFESETYGYLSGDSLQTIVSGNNSSQIMAVADEGYHFVSWQNQNGDPISNVNPISIVNITQDTSLTATFEINTYNIAFTATGNGYLDGDTMQNILHGENSSSVTAIADEGYYFVEWQNQNGEYMSNTNPLAISNVTCDSLLAAVFSINPTSINDIETAYLNVYPNPSNHYLTIEGIGLERIELINTIGEILVNVSVSGDKTILDLSKYPEGIYILNLFNSKEKIVKKIIKN